MQQRVLKPEYKAFFLYKTLQLLLIYIAVGIGLTVGIRLSDLGSFWTLPLLAILVVLLIVHIISTKATYNKTEIQLKPKKILYKTGTLFTNKEVTVTIPKITHLKHTEPFFKQKLFGTSTIQIQAAGTNNAAITLPDIENGSAIFEDIQTTMRENGFSLQRNKVQQKESPDLLRTLLEKGQSILWFTVIPSIIFLTPLYLSFPTFFILTITIVLTLIAVSFYFVYKNTTNTTFILYDDAIEHHNEVFNKHQTILPAENLADVNNNQDLVDRLLSVSNIKITTQGDGSTTYNNIPRGEQIEKHIDNMTKAYNPLLSKNQETPEQKQRVQERIQPQKEKGTTKSYKQNPTRAAIGGFVKGIPIGILIYFFLFSDIGNNLGPFALLFFLTTVILAAIGSSIYAYIQAERRTYEVRPTGIRTTYSLIQKTSNEFSDDKLVGIEVTRNPLDRLCGTAKITFQSLKQLTQHLLQIHR